VDAVESRIHKKGENMKYLLLIILAVVLVCAGCSDGSSGSDGGTTDADTDTDTDTDSDTDPGIMHLANDEEECGVPLGDIRKDDGYEGTLFAARLTPPDYPLQITSVRYQRLVDLEDPACDIDHDQEVMLFSGTDVAPVEEPVALASWTEPAAEGVQAGSFWIEHDLPSETPVVLNTGEYLFVAIRCGDCVADSGEHLCYRVCAEDFSLETNYESEFPTPPYGWVCFDYYFHANLRFEAYGVLLD
jgi:hypothetical protein